MYPPSSSSYSDHIRARRRDVSRLSRPATVQRHLRVLVLSPPPCLVFISLSLHSTYLSDVSYGWEHVHHEGFPGLFCLLLSPPCSPDPCSPERESGSRSKHHYHSGRHSYAEEDDTQSIQEQHSLPTQNVCLQSDLHVFSLLRSSGLFQRAVLLSGSALSPWALIQVGHFSSFFFFFYQVQHRSMNDSIRPFA